jgi:CheY-like chemotaxis protein
MLERLGCHVDVVANGVEALSALDSTEYHLVFMDCQMPEMDGYEATRRIRSQEQARHPVHGRRLPVVALTAHALEGDCDRCLAAGMDDYLSKPFNINQLQKILERWLPAGEADTGTGSAGDNIRGNGPSISP